MLPVWIYRLAMWLMEGFSWLAGMFSPKLRTFYLGHKHAVKQWQAQLPPAHQRQGRPLVWLHASSLGEYEQGRPVLDALKERYPQALFAISFFSPSGYEVVASRQVADAVGYLPFDHPNTVKSFVDNLNPTLVLWVKYDYWYNILKYIHLRKIPILLVSSIFRPEQPFFRWYGGLHRQMLYFFHHLFVQDEISYNLLKTNLLQHLSISINGDTRFDRVLAIAAANQGVPEVASWVLGKKNILVAGSTWPEDDAWLAQVRSLAPECYLMIAPHEVHEARIRQLTERFPEAARLSDPNHALAPVLLIDRVGLLSKLYRYASLCWIGGGYSDTGVHNVLEAAIYGKPVLFGPNHQKYAEVAGLITAGGGFEITEAHQLAHQLEGASALSKHWLESGAAAARYVTNQAGATRRIVDYIERNRLLTN